MFHTISFLFLIITVSSAAKVASHSSSPSSEDPEEYEESSDTTRATKVLTGKDLITKLFGGDTTPIARTATPTTTTTKAKPEKRTTSRPKHRTSKPNVTEIPSSIRSSKVLNVNDILDLIANLTNEYDNSQLLLNLNASLYGMSVTLCDQNVQRLGSLMHPKKKSGVDYFSANAWMLVCCVVLRGLFV